MQLYLVSNGKHMWRHCAQTLALIGLDGGAGVEVLDVLVGIHSDEDVRHVGVDLVLGISGATT